MPLYDRLLILTLLIAFIILILLNRAEPANYTTVGEVHRNALAQMGIETGEAANPQLYTWIWQVFSRYGNSFDLEIEFEDKGFYCGEYTLAVGCYYFAQKRMVLLGNPGNGSDYKRVIAHELAHYFGIIDEAEAGNFAIELINRTDCYAQ